MNLCRVSSILLIIVVLTSIMANTVFSSRYDVDKLVGVSYLTYYSMFEYPGKAFRVGDSVYIIGPTIHRTLGYPFNTIYGIYVAKIYSNGTFAWIKFIGNPNSVYSVYDAEYSNGHIYAAGIVITVSQQSSTAYLIVLDISLDGEIENVIRISSESIAYIPSVLRVINDTAYIAGYVTPLGDGGSFSTGYASTYGSVVTYESYVSAFVSRINLSAKSVEWIKVIDFDSISSEASEVIFDIELVNDTIYCVGAHNGSLFVLKMNSYGEIISCYEYVLPLPVTYASIWINNDNIFVEGEVIGTLPSNKGGGTIASRNGNNSAGTFGSVVSSNNEEKSLSKYIIKLNTSGGVVWGKIINNTSTMPDNALITTPLWSIFGKMHSLGDTLYIPLNKIVSENIYKSYIVKLDSNGELENVFTIFPESNTSFSLIDLDNNIITGHISTEMETTNITIYVPVPYVIWSKIPWTTVNITPDIIDVTDRILTNNVSSITIFDVPVNVDTASLPISTSEVVSNPIYINYKVHISQEDLGDPVAHVAVDVLFMNSTIDTINALLIPNSTSIVERDYGWFVSIQDLAIIYSPIRITELSINNASVSLVLEHKANISIVVPQNTVKKIIVDGVPVCDSINTCETLRDTDNVIVVDPSNVTIYFASPIPSVPNGSTNNVLFEGAGIGEGRSLGGKVSELYTIHKAVIFGLFTTLLIVAVYVYKKKHV